MEHKLEEWPRMCGVDGHGGGGAGGAGYLEDGGDGVVAERRGVPSAGTTRHANLSSVQRSRLERA